MARRKRKQSLSYLPALTGEEWLASWAVRVGYVPPPVLLRGQVLRKVTVEGMGTVVADPTRFTPCGLSRRVQKRTARLSGRSL